MKYVEFAEGEDIAGYEGQRYSKTGAMAYAQDVNGTFKRGAYYLAEEGYVGTKFVKIRTARSQLQTTAHISS